MVFSGYQLLLQAEENMLKNNTLQTDPQSSYGTCHRIRFKPVGQKLLIGDYQGLWIKWWDLVEMTRTECIEILWRRNTLKCAFVREGNMSSFFFLSNCWVSKLYQQKKENLLEHSCQIFHRILVLNWVFAWGLNFPPGGKMPNNFQYWNISHISVEHMNISKCSTKFFWSKTFQLNWIKFTD